MEEFVKQTFLYDFYGEIAHKAAAAGVRVCPALEDYSLSEVAQELGISLQGVFDMIKRCNKTLEEYEKKLHLVEKFLHIRRKVHQIHLLTEKYGAEDIAKISNEILEEL